MLVVVTIMAIL
ncbi:MAG: hypothetical protein LBQ24_00950 [Candidatus Peribacteria bacterium]|nr:hypothetical protein [Candidatus Peribacteria bacterium]